MPYSPLYSYFLILSFGTHLPTLEEVWVFACFGEGHTLSLSLSHRELVCQLCLFSLHSLEAELAFARSGTCIFGESWQCQFRRGICAPPKCYHHQQQRSICSSHVDRSLGWLGRGSQLMLLNPPLAAAVQEEACRMEVWKPSISRSWVAKRIGSCFVVVVVVVAAASSWLS